jgi:hypothetical protein
MKGIILANETKRKNLIRSHINNRIMNKRKIHTVGLKYRSREKLLKDKRFKINYYKKMEQNPCLAEVQGEKSKTS